jgi:hypothetical protein
MSETPKVELGGHNAKDWALIFLIGSLGFVFVVVAIAFAMAIANPESNIVLTGSLDISQWTVVILGIAIVAVTVVTQQLTAKAQQAAVAATDKVWLESEALAKKG